MTKISHSPPEAARSPLAFHLRRLRQWHGDKGLMQAELAYLSGVSLRFLRGYEGARKLPRNIKALIALSLALEVPIEELIAPQLTDALRGGVAERQKLLSAFKNTPTAVSRPL